MAGFFFFAGTLLLQLFEPDKSLLGCSSAVITSLCNTGPGFAEFRPTKNFTSLSTPGALMLPCLIVPRAARIHRRPRPVLEAAMEALLVLLHTIMAGYPPEE